MTAETLLRVEDLKKYFPIRKGVLQRVVGNVRAVDGISFTVRPGETLGVVGESGCGKSTMARTILRLIEPTSGVVEFEGKNVVTLTKSAMREMRREMQIVFQDPYASLNPRYSIGKTLLDPMEIHHLYTPAQRKQRVAQLLDKVGLDPDYTNRFAHEFSGGQRQRIGIARALTVNPKLLILDEPVAALDVSVQSQVLNLLSDLQDDLGLTYIFVAHDLSVVRYISDRVLVLYLGHMAELTDADELFANPLHPYTRALLSAVPVPDPDAKRERIILKGDLPSPANPPAGCPFHTRCPVAMDVCSKEVPAWQEVKPGHRVACHLYQ
ncbi:ABC transporter ATP-binding protein [Alicyclobacillus mengziensis]|uniref:Dipeptide ABC transporter ATP-binding protein n=1 Tax=Alicyclobacillus mengziensis TaxID=2931921 RepID=A0A9X7W2H3_9BACL|nr:dipeptide ABC transporter ATP-binding protein [Alicyclobacillus mengziensis]QSO48972.1 dipeptide ABC transporter ATP-binding protein [Alicyclobacillus mengziensis]